MAGLQISGSTNVAVLDSRVIGDLCAGQFIVDASPSVFIGGGASSVLGIKVKITNPYGAVIKPYTSNYDIEPPLTTAYSQDIPTQAGKPQYGTYTVALQLTDSDEKTYEVVKTINLCSYTSDSNPCDDRLKVTADCKNGKLNVAVAEPPTFKGKWAESKTTSLVIDYPTASGQEHLTTSYSNFSLPLFQGVYRLALDVCAAYNFGDNVILKLPYEVTLDKNVKCLLDYECIWPRIKNLKDKIDAGCSQKDAENYASIALNAVFLLKTAELANNAGADASPYIDELEKLLGCSCTCDCSGSPIVNGSPSSNLSIEGCNVVKETVGLTDVYTINNYVYLVAVDDNQSILTVSDPSQYGCTMTQQLGFNIAAAYAGIKTQISTTDEYNYWAGVVNNALAGVDAACLGYTTAVWNALTLKQKVQVLINAACAGGRCSTSVSDVSTSQQGSAVLISFTQVGGYNAEVYVDGELKATVLSGENEVLLPDYADGEEHEYAIIPKCSNGSQGTAATGLFGYLACPAISAPSVSSNNVNGVECPYDLTALIDPAPPMGIEVEWHTANNTKASTLVADPTSVSSGVFYAFSKNSDGCYSTATQVTLICEGESSCTAPQTLQVVNGVGGFKVSFQSAAYPPPSNSYTVKRKAASDPDIDGSYTTIGIPVWNSSTNRWEITDASASNNTLYTYKAISNCGGTTPSVMYNFANINCPVLSLAAGEEDIDYSFIPVGGEVDKYEVSLYDNDGVTLLSTQTIVPSFPSPIEGTFFYLTSGNSYKVRVKVFIGSFSKTCPLSSASPIGGGSLTLTNTASTSTPTITELSPEFEYDIVSGSLPNEAGDAPLVATHNGFTEAIFITVIGVVGECRVRLLKNGSPLQCKPIAANGVYDFDAVTFLASDDISIEVEEGICS